MLITVVQLVCTIYRDDEHRTGLMLAAAEGHIPVMKILLDNLAAVNDGDKMKVGGKRLSLVVFFLVVVHFRTLYFKVNILTA